MLFLLNPKYYQNEIWSNTSLLYDHGDWKLVPRFFTIFFYDFIKMTI